MNNSNVTYIDEALSTLALKNYRARILANAAFKANALRFARWQAIAERSQIVRRRVFK